MVRSEDSEVHRGERRKGLKSGNFFYCHVDECIELSEESRGFGVFREIAFELTEFAFKLGVWKY